MPEKPRPLEEVTNAVSGRSNRERRSSLGPSNEVRRFVETYKDELKPGDSILELGVGEGRNLEAFKDLDLKLHGIELDPQGVEMCRQNLTKQGIEAYIKEGSFTDLSAYDNESMKAVFSQYAVQNAKTWKDLLRVFSEVQRVLEPGGLYLFREQRHPFVEEADRHKRVAYITEEEVQELADQFNFEIVEGETPVDTKEDLRRIGGKQSIWSLVLRKKLES
ncbi:class I SAM-dependent methyltransferase [Patescibacteria group bacterium]|nr:class I SAM-dependent methyltransferase [Patescibacteria group bacterium]MBU1890241.1 class I SAM-dependent methyltransferase [Patescibacteria group bacterium]